MLPRFQEGDEGSPGLGSLNGLRLFQVTSQQVHDPGFGQMRVEGKAPGAVDGLQVAERLSRHLQEATL